MAETFNVTQVTNLSGLGDGDAVVDPGEVVTTTVTITNQSTTTAATGVSFAEVLQGMTQVDQGNDSNAANDINVSPLAFDDSYNSVGNTTLTVSAANGVLGGAVLNVHETFAADTEFLSQSIGGGANQTHVVAGTFATAQGGSVTIAADGSFTYTPLVGFEGTGASADTFTYTLRDAGLDGIANNADDLTGTGTVSIDVGPVVWFIDNTAAPGGNGTQGSPFNSIAAFNAVNDGVGNHPAIGDTVYLATGTGTYSGADGVNLLNGQTLIGAGEALTITPSGGGSPVTIFAAGTAPVISVTGATGDGVSLAQNNTLKGFAISTTNAAADGIEDGGGSVGTLTISNISISGTGQAVDIDQGGTLNVSINSLSSSGSSEQGVQLAATGAALTGTFTANGGSISGSTGAAFQVGAAGANTGGTVAINFGASLSSTGAAATVDIQERAAGAGTVTLSGNLTHTGNGTAIVMDDNVAGTVTFSGTSKVLNSGTSTAVNLTDNTGATINFTGGGLDVDTSSGTGFNATNGGTINVTGSNNTVTTTTGQIANLSGVNIGSSGVTFTSLQSTGTVANDAISINNVDGAGNTFNGGAVAIAATSGANSDGIIIEGGSNANFSFSSAAIGSSTNNVIGDDGIDLNGANGAVTFTTVNVNGTTGAGIETTGNTNAIDINGGTIGNTNDAAGIGLDINGGTGNVTSGATVNKTTAGDVVEVTGRSAGTVDFNGGITSANGGGIDINTNIGGTVRFDGGMNLSTGAATALNATGNTGMTLVVTDTVSTSNILSTTTGTALNVANTTIGAEDLTFQSISSNGGSATGIILDTTGSTGGLHVTGLDGGDPGSDPDAGSGGTIANKTGADGATTTGNGIYLNNTTDVRLAGMQLNDFQNSAIRGFAVSGFSLEDSVISGAVGNNTGPIEGAIAFGNVLATGTAGLTGNSLIDNVNISGSIEHHIEVYNQTGTANLTISNSNIHDNSVAGGSDGIQMEIRGDAQAFVNIDTNQFSNNKSQAIQLSALENSNLQATIQSNTVARGTQGNEGILITNGGSADARVLIGGPNEADGNTISGFGGVAIFVGQVPGQGTGSSLLEATIQNNTVTSPVDATNHAILAFVSSQVGQVSQTRLLIDDNTVNYNSAAGRAILVDAPDNLAGVMPEFHATITDNTVTASHADAVTMISVAARNASTGHSDVRGNDVNFTGGSTATGINVREATGGSNVLARGASASNDSGVVLAANNPLSTTTIIPSAGDISVVENNTILLPATPTLPGLPLLAANGGVEAAEPDTSTSSEDTPPVDESETDPAVDTPPVDETPTPPTDSEQPVTSAAPAHPVVVNDGVLSQAELDWFVDAAIARWTAAGLSAEQLAALHDMNFTVADMSGLYLGSFSPTAVTVDADAAGWGWFLDGTPLDDSEFGNQLAATRMTTDPTGAPAGHYDLLTALMHEMGHTLGLGDSYNAGDVADLMYGWLQLGERRLAASGQADAAVTGSIQTEEFLGSPVNIGVLPAGKSVTVQWQATIDPQTNKLITNPVNTGTVSATNPPTAFPDTNTNTVITTLDTLTLGNLVFREVGTVNGVFDGSDVGVDGVALTLFADTGGTVGAWDAGDTLITTTTTAGGGLYSFTGLAPGEYIVRVDQTNFVAGDAFDALVPYQNSSPGNPDPDDNVNNDDNGSRVVGGAAYSLPITLAYNTEPTAGVGNDTNNTLDLGFYPNQAPTITNLNGDNATFVEDGTPILLDDSSAPEIAAAVADSDSTDFNTGNLTVSIAAGGVPAEDALSIVAGNLITVLGNVVSYNGNAIGTFTGGTGGANLVVTFNSVNATPAAVTALVGQIAYQNTNTTTPNSGDRTVNFTVNDGDGGTSTVSAVTLHVTAVNDEPTLVATAVNPTFTEGGAAADIFTAPIVGSTVEAGQTFTSITLTVTNVTDGASEILNIDGSPVALTNLNSVVTVHGTVNVTVASGTATVILSGATLSAAELQTLVDALSYSNTSQDPTDANRVVTITRLVDSGSNVAPNDNTAALSIVSTVNVDAVNDEPTLTATPVNPTFAEDGAAADIFSGVSASTIEAGQNFTSMTLTVTNVTDLGSEILTLDGSDVTLSNGVAVTTASNGLSVTVSLVGNTASVTFGGTLNPAQLQTLVDDLTYRNTSQNPTDANRVVTITQLVDSGSNAAPNDNIATLAVASTVNVNPTNDAPDATITPASYLGQPGVAINLKNNGLSVADIDGNTGSETVTLSVTSGTLTVTAGGSGAGIAGSGTSSVTITGTVAQINALLNTDPTSTVSFIDPAPTGPITLTLAINDNGNTGGGNLTDSDTAQFILDNPPVADSTSGSGSEDQTTPPRIAITLSATDADSGDAVESFSIATLAAHGQLFTVPTGGVALTAGADIPATGPGPSYTATVYFQADADWNSGAGTDSFTYTANDGIIDGPPATATITVSAVSDPLSTDAPVSAIVTEDTPTAITGLSISDVDATLAPAGIYEVTLASTHGALTLLTLAGLTFTLGDGTADGAMTFHGTLADINAALATASYAPDADYNGAAQITIDATDEFGGTVATGSGVASSDSDTINVTVTPANDPVTSNAPASATGGEDTAIAISGLSIADIDAALALGGIYSVTLTATNGTLSLPTLAGLIFSGGSDGTADASMTFTGTLANINAALATASYTGATNFNGAATVTITVTDDVGGIIATGSGAATGDSDVVAVTVTAANDPVTSNAPATATGAEDTAIAISGLSIADVDAALAPAGIYSVTLAATNGTLTLGAGTLSALSFGAGDGTADATMTFTGTLANINAALATASYTGAANFNGAATVTISVTDNVGGIIATGSGAAISDSDVVNVTVTATNDPVTSSAPATATGDEDTAIAISGLSIADVDATLAPGGLYSVTLAATNGTLSLSTLAGLTFSGGSDGNADATMTFTGTLANINTALATASFTSALNFNGAATVTISVTDDVGGVIATGSGVATSDSDIVAVTVNAANDPVTSIAPATATAAEDGGAAAITGLSISDVDAVLAPGGIYRVTLTATNGTLTLGAGTLAALSFGAGDGTADASMTFFGTLADINTALATASYTGAANFNGAATVTISVTDDVGGIIATGTGAATSDSDIVAVTVTAANDPVTSIAPAAATGAEDTPIAISGLSIADVDAALAPGGLYSVTLAATNGTLSLATLAGLIFSGGSDGTADATMTFSGTLASINTALATASFTGAANFNGGATVSIAVTDEVGGIIATGSGAATGDSDVVAVTVNAINDAPVNSGPATSTTTENTSLVFSSGNSNLISVGDVDVGGGDLDVVLTVTHGTISLSQTTGLAFTVGTGSNETTMSFSGTVAEIDAALAGLTYTPTAGYSGPASLQITTDDNGQTGNGGVRTDSDIVAITVDPINHAPSGTSRTITALEDTARVLTAADFGFSDVTDGDTLAAVKISTLPGVGTLRNNGVAVTAGQTISIADINAGRLTFQAALNANGAAYAAFNFQVKDNGGTAGGGVDLDQTPNTLTVNVTPVNDKPSAVVLSNVHGPFPENTSTAVPIKVANIGVADVDGGTNNLSLSGLDANLFQIIGSTLWLKAGARLDYETNPFLNVNVNVNDPTVGGPIDATKALAIRVTDIAENITGTARGDRLVGTNNGETINGLAGNDTIFGLAGNDRIIGGLGVDRMTGGPGNDVFVFNSISDSAPGQSGYVNNGPLSWLSGNGLRDVITDFTHGQDKINLSAIDANNQVGGNQAFTWLGQGSFHNHHPGELIYRLYNFTGTASDKTIIYGDVNGDAKADFQIELTGLKALVASDFVL